MNAPLGLKSKAPSEQPAIKGDKTPSTHNRRLEDVLEYEEVDDELRELLKRLLNKQGPLGPKSKAPSEQPAITCDKTPSNHNKGLEDVLEYEEVDDELRDLLKRLLNKQPPKRITLKEVKRHP